MGIKRVLWYLLCLISVNGFTYFTFALGNKSFNLTKWTGEASGSCAFVMFTITVILIIAFVINEDHLKK